MPELPEVETVRRGLNRITLHQEIQGGEVLLSRTIAHPFCIQTFLTELTGKSIAQWHRRGKYLLAELTNQQQVGSWIREDAREGKASSRLTRPSGLSSRVAESATQAVNLIQNSNFPASTAAGWLGTHLRMTGQFLWVDRSEPLQKHTRVRLFFAHNKELRFVDQRTFGQMWLVPAAEAIESVITGLQQLGPEPFSDQFSDAYFLQQLQNRRRPIKNALLDQTIVAGIGNIYADEALFLSGIHPESLCTNLSRQQIQQLRQTILQVLQTSIDAKGTTFSTFRNVEGVNGNYGGMAWVYARDGKACRNCATVIQRLKMAGRSAHFCPTCQK